MIKTVNALDVIDKRIAMKKSELDHLRRSIDRIPFLEQSLKELEDLRLELAAPTDPAPTMATTNGHGAHPVSHSRGNSIGSRVVRLLKEQGGRPVHGRELFTALNVSKVSLTSTLRRYRKRGLIKKTKPNTYVLPR